MHRHSLIYTFYAAIIWTILWIAGVSFAYMDDYPPYEFKKSPPAHLNVKPLVKLPDISEYRSKDGSVVAHIEEPRFNHINFSLMAGNTLLASFDETRFVFPHLVVQADLDNNGFDDFIVFYNYRGCGLASRQDKVEIFLRKSAGGYEKISYDTFDAGAGDFVGPDKDGKYEVVITGFYRGDKHNYFTYNIYEFNNYRLVNADTKFKGFPKFIWYTHQRNDKDTALITGKERLLHAQEINNSILYEEIK